MKKSFRKLSLETASASALITAVVDLLQPLGPVAAYVAFISGSVIIILAVVRIITQYWSESFRSAVFFSAFLFILSSFVYWAQDQTNTENEGVIASSFPILNKMQKNLNIIPDISKTLDDVSENTSQTAESTKILADIEQSRIGDPKKQLLALGRDWDPSGLKGAIEDNNSKETALFFEAGWKIKTRDIMNRLINGSDSILDTYLSRQVENTSRSCEILLLYDLKKLRNFSDKQKAVIKKACGNKPEFLEKTRENLEDEKKYYDARYERYERNVRESKRSELSCQKELQENDNRKLKSDLNTFKEKSIYVNRLQAGGFINNTFTGNYSDLLDKLTHRRRYGLSYIPVSNLVAQYCSDAAERWRNSPPEVPSKEDVTAYQVLLSLIN